MGRSLKPIVAGALTLMIATSQAIAINDKNNDPSHQPGCVGAGVCFIPKFVDGAKTVDAKEANELLKDPKITVLDVRDRTSYEKGHLPLALQIEDSQINGYWLSIFLKEPTSPVLFYGRGPDDPAASNAALLALDNHYVFVYYFYGGLKEWKQAGLPLMVSRTQDTSAR